MESALTEAQWRVLGSFLKQVHASSLSSDLTRLVATETYRPAELDLISQIDQAVSRRNAGEPAAFWTARRDEILSLAACTEELGRELARLALPRVLCHADLHTNNVMIDRGGELWVIDWDEPTRAPKERDLMFVVGGIRAGLVEPHETARFFEGYGEMDLNSLALTYYRHAWAVQDIGSYAEQVFLAPALGAASRADAARCLRLLFEPGAIVEIARESS